MLVGRTEELSVINDHYNRMLSGKGSVLFISGEAGLGKTTLVHEWWNTIAPSDEARKPILTEAACSIPIANVDVGELEAFQPWADIVVQLEANAAEEKSKGKLDLKKLIHECAPAWAWALPIVGDVAHAVVETTRVIREQKGDTRNPNASNQQQVFQQYVNLLSKVAEQSPLVIFLDDMHWADVSSTNLLFYLSRQIGEKNMLVLVTYRPDDAIAANDGKGHPLITVKNEILRYDAGAELQLGYLGGVAIRELLKKTFLDYTIDDKFERWLRKISDGNSLFVTQFIRTLREDGHLNEHGVFGGRYEDISIPLSALAVVEERTRRLDKPTKKLLSYATAEGEEFTSYVLAKLVQKKPLEVLDELKEAQRMSMIQEKGRTRVFANRATTVFGFSHALFHKALYDGLLDEEKDLLHRECFEILKAEWDSLGKRERLPSLASKLMVHAEKCGELLVAAEIAVEAATNAYRSFAEKESLEMTDIARKLLSAKVPAADEPRRMFLLGDAILMRSRIDLLRGRSNESIKELDEAFKCFQSVHDDRKMAEVFNALSWAYGTQGIFDKSEEAARQALALTEKTGDTISATMALSHIGNAKYSTGAYEDALAYFRRSMEVSESIGNNLGASTALGNIGNAYYALGDYDQALVFYKRCLVEMEASNDRVGVANTYNNIGAFYAQQKEYDQALEYYRQGLELDEALGDHHGTAVAISNMGIANLFKGDLPKARTELEAALRMAEESSAKDVEAIVLCQMGGLCETEGLTLEGQDRAAKLREGIVLLEKGVNAMHEIHYREEDFYRKELERMRREHG
jgi:predicted ATPase